MAKKENTKAKAAEVKEEVAAPVAEKPKRVPPTNSPLPSVQPLEEGEIGAPDIAKKLGVDAREFRNYLRATKRDMESEEKGTRYRWKKDDPAIKEIVAGFKAWKAAQPERKARKPKVEAVIAEESADELEDVEAGVLDDLDVEDVTEEVEVDTLDDFDIE